MYIIAVINAVWDIDKYGQMLAKRGLVQGGLERNSANNSKIGLLQKIKMCQYARFSLRKDN